MAGQEAVWTDGEPANVEAAISDALEWLELLRLQPIIERSPRDQEALNRATAALASYGDESSSRDDRLAARAESEGPACQRCHELRPLSLRGLCEECEDDTTIEGGING